MLEIWRQTFCICGYVRVWSKSSICSTIKENLILYCRNFFFIIIISNLKYFGQKGSIEVKFSDFWVVGWKFAKFSCHLWNHKLVFLNHAWLFSVIKDNSSVLSQLKLYMIWTKGAPQSARFQTLDCSTEIPPNLYFDRLLLLKVYKILDKKLMQNLTKDSFVVSKLTRIWWIAIQSLLWPKKV